MAFETIFIVAQIAVVMGFLILVLYSKHMHIFTAPHQRLASSVSPRPSGRSAPRPTSRS